MNAALAHWAEGFGLAWTVLRDRARAEDLCQDALVRLGDANDVDLSRPVRELFLTIVQRLAISELRRHQPGSLDTTDTTVDDAPGPLEAAGRSEETRQTLAALERLDPGWRLMLYLRDGLGLSYREISGVAGKSEDVVRVTLHRARMRARELLNVDSMSGERS